MSIAKKITTYLLTVAGLFVFTSCFGGDPAQTTPEDTSVTTEPEEPPIKVGFIYNDTVEDSTLTLLFENARLEAEKLLGVETCYLENVLVSDFTQAVETLKDEGCTVIVSASAKFANILETVAPKNTSVKFVSFGGKNNYSNVSVFEGKLYQASYVTGLVGAFNSTKNVLGIVADSNCYSVYPVLNGYILGAKELTGANTDVRLAWASSHDEEEAKQAVDFLVEQGADVIFVYQDSDHAIKYCEKLGIKTIGFAYNMAELAPNTQLTGIYYYFNTFIVEQIRMAQFHSFNGKRNTDGLGMGAVRMNETSANALEGTAKITQKVYDLMIEGDIPIFAGEIINNHGDVVIEKGVKLTDTQIPAINWLEKSVTKIKSFSQPVTNPISSDFIVRY